MITEILIAYAIYLFFGIGIIAGSLWAEKIIIDKLWHMRQERLDKLSKHLNIKFCFLFLALPLIQGCLTIQIPRESSNVCIPK